MIIYTIMFCLKFPLIEKANISFRWFVNHDDVDVDVDDEVDENDNDADDECFSLLFHVLPIDVICLFCLMLLSTFVGHTGLSTLSGHGSEIKQKQLQEGHRGYLSVARFDFTDTYCLTASLDGTCKYLGWILVCHVFNVIFQACLRCGSAMPSFKLHNKAPRNDTLQMYPYTKVIEIYLDSLSLSLQPVLYGVNICNMCLSYIPPKVRRCKYARHLMHVHGIDDIQSSHQNSSNQARHGGSMEKYVPYSVSRYVSIVSLKFCKTSWFTK